MTLLQEIEPLQNLVEMFWWRCSQYQDKDALLHKKDGQWLKISYRSWQRAVEMLSTCLSRDLSEGDAAVILSSNRPEWTIADFAVMLVGGVVVPIYPTSIPREISFIINDCSAKLAFVADRILLDKLIALKNAGEIPSIRTIIVFDEIESDHSEVCSLSRYLLAGRLPDNQTLQARIRAIDTDSVMTVIYTSGTTGNPKGVMLTHRNILSNIVAAVTTIGEHYFHEGCLLSFLPLSHGLERSCGYYLAILAGVSIAYAESIPKLLQNFAEIKPTILVSVPRIYEKIYAGVLDGASNQVKRKILAWALEIGRQQAFHEVEGKPVDFLFPLKYRLAWQLVFSKLHQRLGGRFRFAACGGAPLSKEVAIFLKGAGVLVIEGYGQTETSPILTLNGPDRMRFGSVGKPVPGVELRLEPDPEGRQGSEILARGPNIMKGYFGKPVETKATVSDDGWIRTGDIGYIDDDGFLFITDRKKELLKTSGGKFIAPAPIENMLKNYPQVEQACIIGNNRKFCSVLIFPNFVRLKKDLDESLSAEPAEVLRNPAAISLFQVIIDQVNGELNHWEKIKKFAFLDHELTADAGELTPTLKMKRRIIDERYRALIDALYFDG
jgi:long-chain acyl-CoA synthetase